MPPRKKAAASISPNVEPVIAPIPEPIEQPEQTAVAKKPKKKYIRAAEKPKYAKRGQPTKFTPKTKEKILKAIRLGLSITKACNVAGIEYNTYRNWETKALYDKEPDYVDFFQECERAKDEREAFHLNQIVQASRDGTWQASAWFLERSLPNVYGRSNRVEVTGKDGGPVQSETKIEVISPVEILRLISPSIVIDADYRELETDSGEPELVCSGDNAGEE